jgi:hypothetical protein
MNAPGDHPHTDPGDGRTECNACGKFVWPVIHSCKRVPVTDAARARAGIAEVPPPVTAETIVEQMDAINKALEQARRSYHETLSTMGAHGAPAEAVVEFAMRWRLEQVPRRPAFGDPGVAGLLGPSMADMAKLVVDALHETGHIPV